MKKDINTVYPTQLYKYKWRSQTLDLLVVKETCQHLRFLPSNSSIPVK